MSYRIEKLTKKAELLLADGTKLTVSLHLFTRSPLHGGRELIRDLLENEERFLPAVTDSSRVIMVNKANLVSVSPLEQEIFPDPQIVREEHVRVSLDGGAAIEGSVYVEKGEGWSRLSDHLARSTGFLHLTESGRERLVNVGRIVSVEPLIPR